MRGQPSQDKRVYFLPGTVPFLPARQAGAGFLSPWAERGQTRLPQEGAAQLLYPGAGPGTRGSPALHPAPSWPAALLWVPGSYSRRFWVISLPSF